ncbi:patatin-like phospholipase family protein [Nannocystaceae bacterium ST9]
MIHADWLRREPFTLVLSAGFFGFFAHTGVLLGLEEAGLRARRVIGVSAGAIAGGLWASGIPAHELADALAELRREDFWDPSWRGWANDDDPGTRLGLLRGRKLDALLAEILATTGIDRIEDCPIEFTPLTQDLFARRTVAHREGPLRPAIRASAALPGMFGPVRIAGRLHADGGIGDRSGLGALERGERALYHHLPRSGGTGLSRLLPGAGSEATDTRVHDDRRVLAITELPRVGPQKLHRGPLAMARAREATLRWLERER